MSMTTHHSARQQPEREQNDAIGQQQAGTLKRDSDKGGSEGGGTKIAVYGALAANVLIAIAKLGAGFLSGSSAMLAEGAHSIADTMNEVFLLIGLRLERSPADEEHPYGYGKDRFLWSFLAAVFIFFAGGLFSIYNGAHSIIHVGQSDESFLISYVVLGVSFVFESASLLVSLHQFRKAAKAEGDSIRYHFKTTADTSIKVPILEDSAALVGLALAGLGLVLSEFTGNRIFDGLASMGIGLLLLGVAWGIGTNSRDLLLGAALPKEDRQRMREIILSFPEVTSIYRLLTMRIGTKSALVTAEIHLIDGLNTDQIEQLLGRIEQAIRQQVPEATQIFLEAHPSEQPSETGIERAGALG